VNLVSPDGSRPVVELLAVVDPLSRGAQKMAPIIQTLMGVVNCDIKLVMNPKERLSELPLKRLFVLLLAYSGNQSNDTPHFKILPLRARRGAYVQ
jgi:hypothetical protein